MVRGTSLNPKDANNNNGHQVAHSPRITVNSHKNSSSVMMRVIPQNSVDFIVTAKQVLPLAAATLGGSRIASEGVVDKERFL